MTRSRKHRNTQLPSGERRGGERPIPVGYRRVSCLTVTAGLVVQVNISHRVSVRRGNKPEETRTGDRPGGKTLRYIRLDRHQTAGTRREALGVTGGLLAVNKATPDPAPPRRAEQVRSSN